MSRPCPRCTLRHHPNCPTPTWPTAPLVELAGGTRALCRALGWTDKGFPERVTDAVADRYATRLGFHPDQVWPGWTEAGLTVHDAAFVAGGWRRAWLHDSAVAS